MSFVVVQISVDIPSDEEQGTRNEHLSQVKVEQAPDVVISPDLVVPMPGAIEGTCCASIYYPTTMTLYQCLLCFDTITILVIVSKLMIQITDCNLLCRNRYTDNQNENQRCIVENSALTGDLL